MDHDVYFTYSMLQNNFSGAKFGCSILVVMRSENRLDVT